MTLDRDDVLARARALRRELERDKRDRRLRAGLAKPRTAREAAIFAADLHLPANPTDGPA